MGNSRAYFIAVAAGLLVIGLGSLSLAQANKRCQLGATAQSRCDTVVQSGSPCTGADCYSCDSVVITGQVLQCLSSPGNTCYSIFPPHSLTCGVRNVGECMAGQCVQMMPAGHCQGQGDEC
jgi:hypothetical protein